MVMERREIFSRLALLLILMGLPLLISGFLLLRPILSDSQFIDIHMLMPEVGGFSQDLIQLDTGEAVRLRFYADDVTHGIAIGPNVSVDLGAISPGTVGEISLSFGHAGSYTYYCTTWCSPNHWRMRGQIIVRDPNQPNVIPTSQVDETIANLQAEGIDIDTPRYIFQDLQGVNLVPLATLDGWTIPFELEDSTWRRTHSPIEASELLAELNPEQSPERVYAAVATLWLPEPNSAGIDAQYLYNQNCAACHGETGFSEGIGAFTTNVQPAALGMTAYMFMMRSDVLYAKIRRGGMGTDMPNFGTILSQAETWALVDYLWQLALRNE